MYTDIFFNLLTHITFLIVPSPPLIKKKNHTYLAPTPFKNLRNGPRLGCAIPPPIPELVLAFMESQSGTIRNFFHNLRLVATDFALLAHKSPRFPTNAVRIHHQGATYCPRIDKKQQKLTKISKELFEMFTYTFFFYKVRRKRSTVNGTSSGDQTSQSRTSKG